MIGSWHTRLRIRVASTSSQIELVFGINQSLDGYVDHTEFSPSLALFRHLIEQAHGLAGSHSSPPLGRRCTL
jgi:hypothetical protein